MQRPQGHPLYVPQPKNTNVLGQSIWAPRRSNEAVFEYERTEGMGNTRKMATKMAENLIGPRGPIAQSKWPGHSQRKSRKARKNRKQSRKQRR
jgi:hypothetical protein